MNEYTVSLSYHAPLPNALWTLAEHYTNVSKRAGFTALYHDAHGEPYVATLVCAVLSTVDTMRFDSQFWQDYCYSFHAARYGVSTPSPCVLLTVPQGVYAALFRLRRNLRYALPSDQELTEFGYLADGEYWRVKGAVSASFAVCGAFQLVVEREGIRV